MSTPSPATVGEDHGPLRLVALLAGLGSVGTGVADLAGTADAGDRPREPGAAHPATTSAGIDRTCIDGGHEQLVRVGGAMRSLDVLTRVHDVQGVGRRWAGAALDRTGRSERWRRTVFGTRDDGAYPLVHAAVDRAGARAQFCAVHAALGPSSRLFSVAEHDDGTVAVGWQLTGAAPPATAFERAGLGDAWQRAAAVLDALHGFPATRTTGPWSATYSFGSSPQLRIGTTRWARSPDDPGKRRRAANVTRDLGGDAAFVAAVYQLLTESRPRGSFTRVGRAVEVLVRDDAAAVDLYLAVPGRSRPAPADHPDCQQHDTHRHNEKDHSDSGSNQSEEGQTSWLG